jgi:nicotinamidase-related amidase
MSEHIWSDALSERDQQVITDAGYDQGSAAWDSQGVGETPVVLVIDMQNLIVWKDLPILDAIADFKRHAADLFDEDLNRAPSMGSVAWDALDHIEPFLDAARDNDVPVWYTKVIPHHYPPDHEDLDIVDPIAPADGDEVIVKSYASAFFGTDLGSRLVRNGFDTVVTVGNSTSGCVRATVVDARQMGFDPVVPHECVFDRIEASHKVALLDMWMKYGEVLPRTDVEAYLDAVGA